MAKVVKSKKVVAPVQAEASAPVAPALAQAQVPVVDRGAVMKTKVKKDPESVETKWRRRLGRWQVKAEKAGVDAKALMTEALGGLISNPANLASLEGEASASSFLLSIRLKNEL